MRRLQLLLLLTVTSLACTGCWTNTEINNRAIVTAAAIDKAEVAGMITLTLQMVNPGGIAKGGPEASLLVSTTGRTIFEASRKAMAQISRKPFWGQTQVVVFGEALARQGVAELLDFMDRDFEPNRRMWILVAQGAAGKDVLTAGFGFSPLPATNLVGMINGIRSMGLAQVANLNDFIMDAESPGNASSTGYVKLVPEHGTSALEVDPKRKVLLDGTAIFKECRLVGFLDQHASRGLSFALNKVKDTVISVPALTGPEEQVSLEIINANGSIEAVRADPMPAFRIDIVAETHIGEVRSPDIDLTNLHVLGTLNRRVAESIREEVKTALSKAQDLHSDIFGLGDALGRKYPKVWAKLKERWADEVFPQVEVKIEVRVVTRRMGFIFSPLKAK